MRRSRLLEKATGGGSEGDDRGLARAREERFGLFHFEIEFWREAKLFFSSWGLIYFFLFGGFYLLVRRFALYVKNYSRLLLCFGCAPGLFWFSPSPILNPTT
jgi:hypothetical protein